MFNSPYDTKVGSGVSHQLKKITDRIEAELIIGGMAFKPLNNELDCLMLTPIDTTIPPFAHPLEVDVKGVSKFVVDVRGFTRIDINSNVVISSALDYSVLVERCILQHRWIKDGSKRIFDLGMFQVEAFGRWISSGLRSRFTLDPDATMCAAIAASYYYYCMCDDTTDIEYTDDEMVQIASILGRSFGLSPNDTINIIGSNYIAKDINALINLIKDATNSIRLEKLNIADLYQMFGGTWFGANSREIIAVALEHPPTFAVIIKHAMTERGFRNSMLSQTLKPLEKNNVTHAFLKNYDYLVHS